MVDIPKFCKRQPIEVLMFGWVNALRFNLPTITVEKAVLNFMDHNNIDEEVLSINTALSTYNRMQKEYFQMEKNG
jgi:hypothetical protein